MIDNDTSEVLDYLRANPDTPVETLAILFPAHGTWTLRNLRRQVKQETAFGALDVDAHLLSPSLQELSKPAQAALRAGFFRPVEITVMEMRPVKPIFKKAGHQRLVLSDLHAGGEEDLDAIDVAVQVGQACDVDELVAAGDWFDAHSVSKYVPSPERAARWVDERASALPVIASVRLAFAKKPALWLFGNHDTRPQRYIDAVAPQLQGLFTLPQLLGIDSLDFRYPDDNRVVVGEKLLIIHGEKVRKDSGSSVRAEVTDYGMSVVMGHTHRRGLYEVTTTAQELRGEQPFLGVELGCLCKLTPSYLVKEKTANWQHGAAIITEYDGGLVDVEPIRIHQGQAFFRGRLFESRRRS